MSLVAVFAFNTAVALMAAQAAGRFGVEGHQTQKQSAQSLIDNALVRCWIDSADVDFSRSARNGPKEHELRVGVRFQVAQPAKADIETLEDEASTDLQRATALSNLTTPTLETTTALYAAWSAVFEILDDARNLTLGLPKGSISDKAYSQFKQDEFPTRGGPGILTATSFLEFRVKEAQLGDLGNEPANITMDNTLIGAGVDEVTDDVSKAGETTITTT
ncbi:MAG: hypothetical protein GWP06_00305 [Actinobacteria bacterium]|nr:hypothetical protein [Actinomycetota bacterium]